MVGREKFAHHPLHRIGSSPTILELHFSLSSSTQIAQTDAEYVTTALLSKCSRFSASHRVLRDLPLASCLSCRLSRTSFSHPIRCSLAHHSVRASSNGIRKMNLHGVCRVILIGQES